MNRQKIEIEAEKYCSRIDFSDDQGLSEKDHKKLKKWSKEDFIDGAEWMQSQLDLKN